ncbi:MAG: hypothetical protein KIT31_43155, partial [Deltaproteobacteria bacterium]|nr:hypothetical protein [Deltaproteobacteria bacterium]
RASYEPSSIALGGFLQPQFRLRQDSPVQGDTPGFRFARARLTALAQTRSGNLDVSAYIEGELQPNFVLFDAFATLGRRLPAGGRIEVDVGQMRVPISRQQMLSDKKVAFVDKAQITSIAPDRDIGARVNLAIPKLEYVRVMGGIYNGEQKNQVENINDKFLYAARVEVSPIGRDRPLSESVFDGKFLTVSASYGHNVLASGANDEKLRYYGFDVSGAYRGLSGSFEFLEVFHDFSGGNPAFLPPSYKSNGFNAQLNYMLPVRLPPYRQARLELGARVEEIDRNDTVPIAQPGDPNQSVREITGVATFYLRGHALKAQLAASHFQEIETRTAVGQDATYANDQLLLQLTYVME